MSLTPHSWLDPVANATHRLDHRTGSAAVDLVAQVMNVDVHHVRERVAVVTPYVVYDLCTSEHLARVAHQVFEQRELLGRQLDDASVALGLAPQQIERQVANLEPLRVGDRPPTSQQRV